ncbi:MAG: DUF1294 domain-containing protein [Acetivibrio sp.]
MKVYEKILIYLFLINLAGFISMGMDKQKAKKHVYRISEKTLFLYAVLGGSLGSILGMQVFRHKTKHKTFLIGMPLILVVQVLLFILMRCSDNGLELLSIQCSFHGF